MWLYFLLIALSWAKRELLVITVATDETDGYLRWESYVQYNKLHSKTIGMGEQWKGGDLEQGPGGAHKINMLKTALSEYSERSDLLLLFTDAYDVIITASEDELLNRFDAIGDKADDMRVLISAEDLLWPDLSLESQYPQTRNKRFLCSGGIMAYADTFYKLINYKTVEDGDDDQLFYTKAFLDKDLRRQFGIHLDSRAELFMNLNGASEEVGIKFSSTANGENRLRNTKYDTLPLVIHGNGPSKNALNRLSNYIPLGWRPDYGCPGCKKKQFTTWPKVSISVFVEIPTPFVLNMLKRLDALNYDHSDVVLFIHSSDRHSDTIISKWLKGKEFNVVKFIPSTEGITEPLARKIAMQYALQKDCEHIFFVDGYVQLTNEMTLKRLLEADQDIIAPGLSRYGKLWSNYWGAIASDGYYARSDDYMELVERKRIGVFNQPYISGAYLISAEMMLVLLELYPGVASSPWKHMNFDAEMGFAANCRKHGIFMFVTNEEYFGRLVNTDHMPVNRVHPELWQAEHNRPDWEDDYLDPDYWHTVKEGVELAMPCPDVVAFPFLTEKGGYDMIEEFEHFGKWSGGNNAHEDKRLAGGYENVPTVDIHMNQLGIQEEWLYIVKTYASYLVSKFYTGYTPDNKPNLMFVVRYTPGEQDRLRPHHDASTWTFQIALNKPGIDFEGGGTYFVRYKCSVVGTSSAGLDEDGETFEVKQGMGFAFPGRLTHQHSGLPTTKGTRYILVNFMDP